MSADPYGKSDGYAYRNERDTHRDTSSSYRDTGSARVHHKQVPPEIKTMKNRRKRRTVASGVAGGVLGLVALGPIGGIAAGVGGAMVAKKVGKRNEKKRMDKLEARQNPLRSNGTGEML